MGSFGAGNAALPVWTSKTRAAAKQSARKAISRVSALGESSGLGTLTISLRSQAGRIKLGMMLEAEP